MSSNGRKIRVAVTGIGNCFSALYQGFAYYKDHESQDVPGIMFKDIGGYAPTDIEVVAAFDVDARKVGKNTGKAIFAKPNCARVFQDKVPPGPIVQMGTALDGVSEYM
ncbi:MAG: inositol-3-phosphate synthase, partial [Candidatus Saccharimonadales bacterium]